MEHFGKGGLILQSGGDLTEDKYGLTTGRLVWQVRPKAWELMPKLGTAHPYASFCLLERRQIRFDAGFWKVLCDYAGSEQVESEPEYDLEIGGGREPIETHSRFVSVLAGTAAAPKNGAVFVDETGHPTTDSKLGIFDRFRVLLPDGTKNELAGVTAYDASNQIFWTKAWTSKTRPNDAGDVGKIDNPEGSPPSFDDERNWRYIGLATQKRGGAHTNRKVWQLSGPGGWSQLIYRRNN